MTVKTDDTKSTPSQLDVGVNGQSVCVFTASYAQRSMWFLAQLLPDSPFYNLHIGTRLQAELDVDALERSVNEVVRRHESLRTCFRSVNGEPVQVIAPSLTIPVPVTDLRRLTESGREAEAEMLAANEAETPFDLATWPLIRTRLLRLDEADWIWLLTLHHIVCDYWSLDLLLGELSSLYSASELGVTADLPLLPIQYADFAEWERGWLQGPVAAAHISYWRNQLAELPTVRLPADRSRPVEPSFEGANWEFEIPPATYAGLLEVARSEQATLFMVSLAAFQALLHRCSGQDDIVVGTPAANRNRPEVEHLIGMFANSVVLRSNFTGNPSFREILRRVRTTVLDAFDHQDLPFEVVVNELSPSREAGENPLFGVHFQLLEGVEQDLGNDPLSGDLVPSEIRTAKFDLALDLWDYGDRIWACLEYSTEIFSEAAIQRFSAYFSRILEAVGVDPDGRIGALPMLPDDERRRVVEEWNATTTTTTADDDVAPNLYGLAAAQMERTPDAAALSSAGHQVTFRELADQAAAVDQHLRSLHVGPEDLVGVCAERSPELVAGVLGALRAGAGFLLLSPAEPKERLHLVLDDAAPKIVLVGPGLGPLMPTGIPASPLADLIETPLAAISQAPPVPSAPRNLAYVMYTSGSTGRPKGVAIEQKSICNHLLWMQSILPLEPEDRVLLKYPQHVDAFIYELFGALVAGARMVIPDRIEHWDPEAFALLLEREEITALDVVPSMLEGLLDVQSFVINPRLRRVVVGGEEFKPHLQEQCLSTMNVELHNVYGPTEATIGASAWRCRSGLDQGTVPIGHPGRNTQAYVLDGYGEPVPIGAIGELHIGGAGVARGYLGAPDLTAERFVPDPFSSRPGSRMYKTGDLARWRSDGSLEYVGRIDHQLKLRGNRVEVGEIETILAAHESVGHCAVVVVEDTAGHKRPVAYVVPTPAPPQLWPSLGEYRVYDEFLYYAMTHDGKRTDAYHRAIKRKAGGKVVLDIGTGADAILARLCAQAGARHVYALELEERAFQQARSKVAELGLSDRVTVLHGDSITVELPEPVDLCVSEIIGTIASSEGVIPILNDARRFLTDAGEMIPRSSQTQIAAVRLPADLKDQPRFDGLAQSYVDRVFEAEGGPFDLRLCIADLRLDGLLSDGSRCETLEFSSTIPIDATETVTLPIVQDGDLDGFLLWVSVQPDEFEHLDALHERLSWLPVYLPVFAPSIGVRQGDVISLTFSRTGGADPSGPDYRIVGAVADRDGGTTEFSRASLRHPMAVGTNEFYARLWTATKDANNGPGSDRHERSSDMSLGESSLELPLRLRRYLQSRLPDYMMPSSIVLVDELPLTSAGKLDRSALARRGRARVHAPAGTLTANEQTVAGVWCDVLNLESVAASDNFFDLGGDSILIVQVRSRLASMLKRELSVIDLFRYPTVAALAEHLGGDATLEGEALEQAQLRGSRQRVALEQRRQRRMNQRAQP